VTTLARDLDVPAVILSVPWSLASSGSARGVAFERRAGPVERPRRLVVDDDIAVSAREVEAAGGRRGVRARVAVRRDGSRARSI
jgi:hypothetical protein